MVLPPQRRCGGLFGCKVVWLRAFQAASALGPTDKPLDQSGSAGTPTFTQMASNFTTPTQGGVRSWRSLGAWGGAGMGLQMHRPQRRPTPLKGPMASTFALPPPSFLPSSRDAPSWVFLFLKTRSQEMGSLLPGRRSPRVHQSQSPWVLSTGAGAGKSETPGVHCCYSRYGPAPRDVLKDL